MMVEREHEAKVPAGRVGRGRRLRRGCGLLGLVLLALLLVVVAGLYLRMRASLPPLDGEIDAPGLLDPVQVERDDLGIPTLRAQSRSGVAYGLGFVHGQDRFFQMDMLRRQGGGELSELFGARTARYDQRLRRHRFRALAGALVTELPEAERELLTSYAEGVNRGLESLGAKPFEYLVLRTRPEPWKAEDSLVVQWAMFQFLQDSSANYDDFLDRLADSLPPEAYQFLTPWGTPWDSPLAGEAIGEFPVPGPEICSFEGKVTRIDEAATGIDEADWPAGGAALGASNAWVLSGQRTASGAALLAGDMHLPLSVPNLWYRASFSWPGPAGSDLSVTGITLPGSPLMIAGSNGSVAWTFTNSRVDVSDLIEIEEVADRPGWYHTADGPEAFQVFSEVVDVKGEEARNTELKWSRWGPVLAVDDGLRALRWTAHEEGAVNLDFLAMEMASDVATAIDIAQGSGLPTLNILLADAGGEIGWTLAGRVPRREGEPSGRRAFSWREASDAWNDWLTPEEVPRRLGPPEGVLWNANNRAVGGEELGLLGDGNYSLAARAAQIEDQLLPMTTATEEEMLVVQLDDRALFLDPWRELLLNVLASESCDTRPARCEMRRVVETWTGRAETGSASYTLIRQFHRRVGERLSEFVMEACALAPLDEPLAYFDDFGQSDAPLWRLLEARPRHLLPDSYDSWDEMLRAAVDEVIAEEETPLADRRWGEMNRLEMNHLLGGLLPWGGDWLNMPVEALPGDAYMPRVQTPSYGASQRLAVSPGHEEQGYFHMPGGQSGHPLSPHYRDGHEAWVRGEATPFLPGPPVHVLSLHPVATAEETSHGR